MNQIEYNRDREFRNIERLKKLDNELVGEIQSNLQQALMEINQESNNWYLKYAKDNGISVAEAKKAAQTADIKELSFKAKAYVKWRDDQDFAFSKTANKEMRIYNYSMRMSREELLKEYVGLVLAENYEKNSLRIYDALSGLGEDELRRQAGILGLNIGTPEEIRQQAEIIAKSSFHGETFSDRLWKQQGLLQKELNKGITRSIIMGKNPTAWMMSMGQCLTNIKDNGNYNLRRLAVTEAGRVQIEAQKQSYEKSGYEEYQIICEPSACSHCRQYDDKVFKVKDMEQGVNSPMFHPNCRCSTTAYVDRKELDKQIEDLKEAESLAQKHIQKVMAVEPDITRTLSNIAMNVGGELKGLEHRIKDADSLVRKILTDAKDKGISLEQTDKEINDVLRYTMQLNESQYTDGYFSTVEQLTELGYTKVRVKNTFKDGASYKGVNTLMKKGDGIFELQYHTPESLEVKTATHGLYEEQRVLDLSTQIGRDRFDELTEIMIQESSVIPNPKNVKDIK